MDKIYAEKFKIILTIYVMDLEFLKLSNLQ